MQAFNSKSSARQSGEMTHLVDIDSSSYSQSDQSQGRLSVNEDQEDDLSKILDEVTKTAPVSPSKMQQTMMETAKRQADLNYTNFAQRSQAPNGFNLTVSSSEPAKKSRKRSNSSYIGRHKDVFELMEIPDLLPI